MRCLLPSILLSALLLVCATAPVRAHHYMAEFDIDHLKTLTGTLKEFRWINPHSWLRVLVPDEKGGSTEYTIETTSPTVMRRLGLERTMLNPGDQVQVIVAPKKDGTLGSWLARIVTVNGKPIPGLQDFPLLRSPSEATAPAGPQP
jgi:hypothetical protein